MKKCILILCCFLIIVSCNENKKKVVEKSNIVKSIVVSKFNSSNNLIPKVNSDTLIIKSKCAIIYESTEKNIEKRKKEIGEEKFYLGADDFLFYLNEANEYLESKEIKIITTENDKILKFVSDNKKVTIINLDLEKDMVGVYLFNSKQAPKKINIMDISDEFESYMK
ncbi:MAG TPA: hypothetical protein VJ780_12280 [Flavobacterium sp.]|nr:hypothetical protein [Flavobacterium sp.]